LHDQVRRLARRRVQRHQPRSESRGDAEERPHLAQRVEPCITADFVVKALDDDFDRRLWP